MAPAVSTPLRRVILPIAMPGITVVANHHFHRLLRPAIHPSPSAFNSKTEYMPLPVGLFTYFGRQEGVVWNELMAASFVGIAPAMILIFLMQRYPSRCLTAGAVKQ